MMAQVAEIFPRGGQESDYPAYTNATAAADLAMQGSRASPSVVELSWIILV